MQAYRETVDWMRADPAALRYYAEFAGISEATAKRVRDGFYPDGPSTPMPSSASTPSMPTRWHSDTWRRR